MRYSAFFLFVIFSFQLMDIPPARNTPNSKTCCSRLVCSCTHAKGAHCPIRSAQQRFAESRTAASAPVQSAVKQRPAVSFTKAPCHRDAPKTVKVKYAQDYDLISSGIPIFYLKNSFMNPHAVKFPASISIPGLDPPPRLLPLL